MALTGIDIFRKLPKTNCGDCGVPTCLAFAMKLAAGQAELDSCPHVSDEAKAELSEASAPPIRPVKIGVAEDAVTVGGETVLFRHEKTFVNSPGIAILITDAMDDAEVDGRVDRLEQLKYDRVGLLLQADLVAAKCVSGDAAKFETLVKRIVGRTEKSIVLVCEDPEIMVTAVAACGARKPLIYAATKDNVDAMANLAKNNECPLAVRADSLAGLPELTEKIAAAGVKDLVIDSGSRSVRGAFQDEIIIRRAALVQKYQPLGYPTIAFPCEMTDDPMKETLIAATLIAKYAGIIVMSDLSGETLFPLLLGRMNIYSDPQRPMATKEGIYEIGGPTADSPVLITTNFSLTYFIVSGEVETSRVPTWLLIKDCEGLSVMTAWAAGKFVADAIAPMVAKSGITDKVSHRKLIIPGYAAAISGEMEEELPDWEIQIGPREASHLPAYLKGWSA
jgi:acetyl-CoA decarbonylase/synthase complex subunit gamma